MKPCNTCPFKKNTENTGSPEWLEDVSWGLMTGSLNHTCHQTDEKADGFKKKSKGESICYGAVALTKKYNNDCFDSRVDKLVLEDKIKFTEIDGSEVFDSVLDFVNYHFKKIEEEIK